MLNGFVFTGSNNSVVFLRAIKFLYCGTKLSQLDESLKSKINASYFPFYFTQYHAAALLFMGVNDVQMKDIDVESSYGFAIIFFNLPNGTVDSVTVAAYSTTIDKGISVGSGLLILYCNETRLGSNKNNSIILSSLKLQYLFEDIFEYECIQNLYNSSVTRLNKIPIVNAAGLTVLYMQNDFPVTVRVISTTFSHCYGSLASGLLVVHQNFFKNSQTFIEQCTFDHNSNIHGCHGGAIIAVVYYDQNKSNFLNFSFNRSIPLTVSNSTFHDNGRDGTKYSGAINVLAINPEKFPIQFYFKKIKLMFNFASSDGSCFVGLVDSQNIVPNNNVEFIFDSISVSNNSSPVHGQSTKLYYPTSMFLILNARSIINGTEKFPGTFSYNYGSVFKVSQSSIVLEGYLNFTSNTGFYGGAFLLLDSSVILFSQGLRAKFTGNHAKTFGGAIYSTTASNNYYAKLFCSFQVNEDEYDDIRISFYNNTAMIFGDSVYSTNLYNCYMQNKLLEPYQLTSIYETIFNTSLPKKFLFTNAMTIETCNKSSYIGYPGETFHIMLTAKNIMNDTTHAEVFVSAALATYDGIQNIDWWFSEKELIQVFGNENGCTDASVTIHTNDQRTVDIIGEHHAFLLFLIENSNILTKVDIHLHSCPPGFVHDVINTGSCVCSNIIKNIADTAPICDINSKSISRPTKSAWMGVMLNENGTEAFAVSLFCYQYYCNSNSTFDMVTVNTDGMFQLSSSSIPGFTSSLCIGYRQGKLCSSCADGYSVVFGSPECKKCSSLWLLTLLAYAIAGPLLIFIMYSLNLTLNVGTINGIIFYAQASNVGILDALNDQDHGLNKFLTIFLSLLNLGLGFPVCLYDGMNEMWKVIFNLLFPLYLFVIVVLIIILCRFSSKVSNKFSSSSIQVLTTIVYLSFARLLSSVVSAFKPAVIHTTESAYVVWFWDASVPYNSTGHIIIMVVTSLITCPLLMTYLFLLLFPRPLRCNTKLNEWTRPVIESIKAPYKEGRHYWFVARILVITFMYILYSTETYVSFFNVTVMVILIFIVLSQAIFNPYKSKLINLLDCWLLVNLTFSFGALYNSKNASNPQNIFLELTVALFFLTFLCLVLYHFLMISKRFRKIKDEICQWLFQKCNNQRVSENINDFSNRDYYYSPCDEYREPLLKPTATFLNL